MELETKCEPVEDATLPGLTFQEVFDNFSKCIPADVEYHILGFIIPQNLKRYYDSSPMPVFLFDLFYLNKVLERGPFALRVYLAGEKSCRFVDDPYRYSRLATIESIMEFEEYLNYWCYYLRDNPDAVVRCYSDARRREVVMREVNRRVGGSMVGLEV